MVAPITPADSLHAIQESKLIETGGATPAGTLTGAEIVGVSRGTSYSETTTGAIAALGGGNLDPSNQTAVGTLTGAETFTLRQGAGLFSSTLTKLAAWVTSTFLVSPPFTGNPTTATTPPVGDNSTSIPNTAFVHAAAAAAQTAATSAATAAAIAGVTKTTVGLGNVDDTSDLNKPVSLAQATAIALAGSTANKDALGLSFVDNTSDANKPVSTAQAQYIVSSISDRTILRRTLWRPRRRVIAFGDSITLGNSDEGATGLFDLSSTGYVENACWKANGRMTVIANTALEVDTSANMLNRFNSDVLDHNPDIVMMMAGTYDYVTTGQTADITNCMNNIEVMIVLALDAGVLPILVTPPVKSTNVPGWDIVRRSIPFYYRLAEFYGIPLIDMFKVTADPATGNWKTNYSVNGIKPLGPGLSAMTDYAALCLRDIYGWSQGNYLAAVSETTTGQPANLLANGSFALGTASALTNWSPTATNATLTLAAAATLSSSSPWTGNGFSYKLNTAANQNALSGAAVPAIAMNPGDRVTFSGRVNATGMSTTALGFSLTALWASGHGNLVLNSQAQNGDLAFSQEIIVESNTTGVFTPILNVQDLGTYVMNNFTLVNNSAMDAIWAPGNQTITVVSSSIITAPTGADDPGTVESPDLTTMPPVTAIVDGGGYAWTLDDSGLVSVGGAGTNSVNAVLVLYMSGDMYYQDSSGSWFHWSDNSFGSIPGDPRLPPSTGGGGSSSAVSFYGVGSHYGQGGISVQNYPQQVADMTYMGVTTVRQDIYTTAAATALAALIPTFAPIIIQPMYGATPNASDSEATSYSSFFTQGVAMANAFAGKVPLVEMMNEPEIQYFTMGGATGNGQNITDWVAINSAWPSFRGACRGFVDGFRSIDTTKQTLIAMPSVGWLHFGLIYGLWFGEAPDGTTGHPTCQADVINQHWYYDFGNIENAGNTNTNVLQYLKTTFGKPIIMSEVGVQYFISESAVDAYAVSELAFYANNAAKYGIIAVNWYELYNVESNNNGTGVFYMGLYSGLGTKNGGRADAVKAAIAANPM